jgi:hypothetical protein
MEKMTDYEKEYAFSGIDPHYWTIENSDRYTYTVLVEGIPALFRLLYGVGLMTCGVIGMLYEGCKSVASLFAEDRQEEQVTV